MKITLQSDIFQNFINKHYNSNTWGINFVQNMTGGKLFTDDKGMSLIFETEEDYIAFVLKYS